MQPIIITSLSKEAASRASGEKLFNQMEPLLKDNIPFCVDFLGINRFASPFFNNSFAKLALIYGFDAINNITVLNISDNGKTTLQTSIENALMLSRSPEYETQINEIINQNSPKRKESL